ncbi:MAG TPA: rhomboid family intramembrane serine protease [Spirochaetota bacterium]|nr:rhomboid family intramembrane serine protease [Spirochaetota bacterium]HOL57193.1 rhomboid family intramembrane serine protease [Spirochaetota bacterium]HPP04788.1 rhomboid family intramembrane serine protease [Spirochaetota bacterium]
MKTSFNLRVTPIFIGLIVLMYTFYKINSNTFFDLFVIKSSNFFEVFPWRFITYVFYFPENLFFFFFSVLIFYFFSFNLENIWGSKIFFLYLLLSIICKSISAFLFGGFFPLADRTQLYLSLMVAFGFNFPQERIYLFFVIPIRIKILAIISLILVGLHIILSFFMPGIGEIEGSYFNYGFIVLPASISLFLSNSLSYLSLLIFFKKIFGFNPFEKILGIFIPKYRNLKKNIALNMIMEKNRAYLENMDKYKKIEQDKKEQNVVLCDPQDFEEEDAHCLTCENFTKCLERKKSES